MQSITPNLWFDGNAQAAVERYLQVFERTSIGRKTHYDGPSTEVSGQPAGSLMTVEFELEGQTFVALNGGPQFSFNPSVSFMVNCQTTDEVDELWEALSPGGSALMPLDTYPFSERYGWLADEFGVSWQLIHAEDIPERHIVPSLMFVGEVSGQAEEAIELYTSTFDGSEIGTIERYGVDMAPEVEGTIMYSDFTLAGQRFVAMDSADEHDFAFNEAISLIIDCADQAEVDHFWSALTADGGEESQCGWLEDKFGVSWQVIPRRLHELLADEQANSSGQVTEAMLKMKKIDIAELERAANS